MTLNHVQLSKLKKSLRQNYTSLLEEVRDALATGEHQQYIDLIDRGATDTGDEAIGDLLADINLAIIDRHVKEIREVEAATARIAAGGYGNCTDCGEPIAFERLQAAPAATRCVACQQQRERTYAHERTPTL
ncbi:MAG: TraR/DksA family transcriptional regulator [Sterolibacterium sp.]|jgi:RNA polymerase-binding protein DksA